MMDRQPGRGGSRYEITLSHPVCLSLSFRSVFPLEASLAGILDLE